MFNIKMSYILPIVLIFLTTCVSTKSDVTAKLRLNQDTSLFKKIDFNCFIDSLYSYKDKYQDLFTNPRGRIKNPDISMGCIRLCGTHYGLIIHTENNRRGKEWIVFSRDKQRSGFSNVTPSFYKVFLDAFASLKELQNRKTDPQEVVISHDCSAVFFVKLGMEVYNQRISGSDYRFLEQANVSFKELSEHLTQLLDE